MIPSLSLPYVYSEPLTQPFPWTPYISFPVKAFTSKQTFISSCPNGSTVPIIKVTSFQYSFNSQEEADQMALNDAMAKAIGNRALYPCNSF